jgi:hypothetical protein
MKPCQLLGGSATIQPSPSLNASIRMGYFGMCLIANNSIMSCRSVLHMSSMYRWIKREGICREIIRLGGMSFMMRMGKLEDKQLNLRMKKLDIFNQ